MQKRTFLTLLTGAALATIFGSPAYARSAEHPDMVIYGAPANAYLQSDLAISVPANAKMINVFGTKVAADYIEPLAINDARQSLLSARAQKQTTLFRERILPAHAVAILNSDARFGTQKFDGARLNLALGKNVNDAGALIHRMDTARAGDKIQTLPAADNDQFAQLAQTG